MGFESGRRIRAANSLARRGALSYFTAAKMKPTWGVILFSVTLVSVSASERISFNDNWRFEKGDPPGAGEKLNYAAVRSWILPTANPFHGTHPTAAPSGHERGSDVSFAQPDFDDGGWRKLNLPHDWGIEGPFKQEYPGETGKLPWILLLE